MAFFRFLFIFLLWQLPIWASPKVLVSVAPTKYLIDNIADDAVESVLFVPPGTSPHSYEPTMRQIVENENALIWFRIGENFENKIVSILENKMKIVDLRQNLSLMPSRCSCHHIDTHIWLSPHLLKNQAQTILTTLTEILPEKKAIFEKNYNNLISEIDALDSEIKSQLQAKKGMAFLVSHPAFGYFAKDYGLIELSIEIEGKEPTPRQITFLIDEAREKKVKIIITQPQYSQRGSAILAKELNIKTASLDPYAENVIDNLRSLAQILANE